LDAFARRPQSQARRDTVNIGPNSLLLGLATNVQGAVRVLAEVGIDYGEGQRTLAEGCERAGVATLAASGDGFTSRRRAS
jgi:hypothetical protein